MMADIEPNREEIREPEVLTQEHVPAQVEGAPAEPEQEAAATPQGDKAFCPHCGAHMEASDRFCWQCGWDEKHPEATAPGRVRPRGPASDRNRLTALLLCVFIGFLGAHRFYAGRVGSGLVWLLTGGLLFVGVIYDAVMIATGEFQDDDGRRLLHWE